MKNHFKKWAVNDVLAIGAISRAQTGFNFIRRCLDPHPHGTLRAEATSPPYSRQINILITYNFELILNSLIFAGSLKNNADDLINKAKVGHKLDVLWDKMKNSSIEDFFGIEDINLKEDGIFKFYKISFKDRKFMIVHDLNNIRYDINDFRSNEKTKLRSLNSDEENMDNVVEMFEGLSKRIIEHIYKKYPDNSFK